MPSPGLVPLKGHGYHLICGRRRFVDQLINSLSCQVHLKSMDEWKGEVQAALQDPGSWVFGWLVAKGWRDFDRFL